MVRTKAEFDAVKARQQVQASGNLIAIADAATTVIRIHADGMQHEASFYALDMMASQFPKIESVRRLNAVRQRLERLRAEINAGGPGSIAVQLRVLNARLRAQHPKVPVLTADDLQSAWQHANGDLYVAFQRTDKLDGGRARYISANIQYPKTGDPKITINVNTAFAE